MAPNPTRAHAIAAIAAIPHSTSEVGGGQELDAVAAVVAGFGLKKSEQVEVLKGWAAECDPPWGHEAVTAALARAAADRAVAAGGADVTPLRPPQSWRNELTITVNKDGDERIVISTNNLALIFENDPQWRGSLAFDEAAGRVVFSKAPPCDEPGGTYPREIRDTDVARAAAWLETSNYKMFVSPKNAHLEAAISIVAERHGFNVLRDYLTALRWDQAPRLDTMLARYFGAAPTALNAAFGSKWMISAAARALRPGCKVDTALILVGPQGCGKSTAARTLAGDAHYGDDLPNLNSKDAADYLRGLWIVEIAELEALGRGELATVKAFLTRTTDRFRASYARRPEVHPRRCVFIGTTNEHEFLKDATGGRRFWPVTCGHIDLAALTAERDQLWAEAVVRFRAGEPWHITDASLAAAATEAQEERYAVDEWEPIVARWLDARTCDSVEGGEVLSEAIAIPPERWTRADQMRVAAIMRRLGWAKGSQRRHNGRHIRPYLRPQTEAE